MSAVPLRLDGVGKVFSAGGRQRAVLADVDLSVAAGEVVALLGPSGCGKSTLLRLVGGLETASSGSVRVDGREVRGIEARCAVVFQEPRLLPWRSIERNVAFGLPRGTSRERTRTEVKHWLSVVGLAEFGRYRPRQVSGGMAQRAALARALARRPGVLLLDEPFAALDALTRLRMQDLLAEVQQAAGTTVLLVTHDVDEALHLADRVVLLGTSERTREDAVEDADERTREDPGRNAGDDAGKRTGNITPPGAATIRSIVEVPGIRPRDRGDAELAALRVHLLAELGVHTPAPAAAHP
ncbi:ABC transporter ATP-binding protein [Actinoplanes palleronii]|uniref:ABC transporter n=1 Tax=Actinoplanes palleronii TaxID=113570 RepID=A0ABQ4BUR4_9ACTN|nr:ABC transporter ATP-binding protein [Actinoplanes palleronii]GIE74036.1 ABC transporter [Actinoplanes palleronii]